MGFTKPIFYDMFNGVDPPLGTLPAILLKKNME